VSVNVCNGIVELRGQVERAEDIAALGDATAAIDGVGAVHNLLHIPGAPAKHAPPSDRARR
jgi:osmotically-inducible protein OsmY